MAKIVHLALKVDEIDRTGAFYQDVFGFQDAETKKTRDHTSRHMTDGAIDFTLLKYDAGTQSAESKAAGDGPCIHHFAIEVEDMAKATEEILAFGCEIVSDPGVIPVKFRAPGGTIAELVPIGRYKQVASDRKIDRIVHLALKVDEIEKTGDFYKKVFGFRDSETKKTRDHIVAPHDRRCDRFHAPEVRRRHGIGRIEGCGRRPVHPPLRGRGGAMWKGPRSRSSPTGLRSSAIPASSP